MRQNMEALRRANVVRLGIARVKGEVAALDQVEGARLAAGMLRAPDEAVGAVTVDALILSIHWMGVARMAKLFNEARFSVAARHRRVRDLTPRQRGFVAALLDELADTAEQAADSRRTA